MADLLKMTEPTSTTVFSLVAWKASSLTAAAAAIFAGLAALVAMCMLQPRSAREWAVGLVSTFVGSITGGAFVIQYFGLATWMTTFVGTTALLGIVFACGLPAWAIVRWFFTWANQRRDEGLLEVMKEVRDAINRDKND